MIFGRLEKLDAHWRQVAHRLELAPHPVKGVRHRFAGQWRGREIEIFVHRSGDAQLRTRIGAPVPGGFQLVHKRTAAALGLKGLRDLQVGAVAFDHEVIVSAEHPAAAIRLLQEERSREAVLALLRDGPHTWFIGDDVIVDLTAGMGEDQVRASLRKLCDAAHLLEERARELAREAASQRERTLQERSERSTATGVPMAMREERRVLERAARRRRIALWPGIGCLLAATAGLFAVGISKAIGSGSSEVRTFFAAFSIISAGLGVLALIVGVQLYACPACGKEVVGRDGGPDLSAQSCPNCCVRLR